MAAHFSLQAIAGKVFYSLYWMAAEKRCKECEAFVRKGDRVLDLGCGSGVIAKVFQKNFQIDVLGADIQDSRVVDLDFQLIDGKSLPFPSKSFDIVFIFHVLHHACDYLDLLKEAKRVSRKKVIIYEDVPRGFFSNLFCQVHGFLFNTLFMSESGKTYFKSKEDWLKLFESLGLQVVFQKQRKSLLANFYPIKYIQFVLEKA